MVKERSKLRPLYLVTDPSASWTLNTYRRLAEARKLVKNRTASGVQSILWKRV
jgi:hypothetical protein